MPTVKNIKGFTVTIFKGYNGQELFITNSKGEKVYGCRLHKNDSALNRARRVINNQ